MSAHRNAIAYMPGAEPFELVGGDVGIVLMHGFSGSCSEILALGQGLHAAGFSVIAPALAGHGTKPSDLADVTSEDFFATAESDYREARQRFARVYVVGLSLGGTLGLHLAANHPLCGLVTIATPVFMSTLVTFGVPFAKRWIPRRNVISNYAAWRGEVVGYRSTPLSSLAVFLNVLETVKQELPHVRAPLLVLHGAGDQTVPPANAEFIGSQVASRTKEVRIYPRGRHLMTLRPQLAIVESDILEFLRKREAPYVTGEPARSKGAQV